MRSCFGAASQAPASADNRPSPTFKEKAKAAFKKAFGGEKERKEQAPAGTVNEEQAVVLKPQNGEPQTKEQPIEGSAEKKKSALSMMTGAVKPSKLGIHKEPHAVGEKKHDPMHHMLPMLAAHHKHGGHKHGGHDSGEGSHHSHSSKSSDSHHSRQSSQSSHSSHSRHSSEGVPENFGDHTAGNGGTLIPGQVSGDALQTGAEEKDLPIGAAADAPPAAADAPPAPADVLPEPADAPPAPADAPLALSDAPLAPADDHSAPTDAPPAPKDAPPAPEDAPPAPADDFPAPPDAPSAAWDDPPAPADNFGGGCYDAPPADAWGGDGEMSGGDGGFSESAGDTGGYAGGDDNNWN